MTLQLAAIFGDGMVLQREMPCPVWGKAPAGMAVQAELNGLTARTKAGADGRWRLDLPAGPAGGPWTLTVRCGAESIRREQVYRGEVWLAGGQSNMELALRDAQNGEAVVQNSADPRLHFYLPAKVTTPEEAEAAEYGPNPPSWRQSSPKTSGEISAVAWYAARTLSEHLQGVPIGVVVCCWGGTYAHCWMPRQTLASFPEGQRRIAGYDARMGQKSDGQFAQELAAYQKEVDAWNARIAARRAQDPQVSWETLNEECGLYPWPPPAGRTGFQRPGNLYEAMLRRVAPYALRGFWYYQGEQDEEWPQDYSALLTALIRQWRQDWEDSEKLFLLVQLPMYISKADALAGDPMRWPVLRQAQADAAQTLPNTALVVLADCGEYDNIHPVDKRTPGTRLGLLALEKGCHMPVTGTPPVCVEARREGRTAVLRFEHTGGGLRRKNGGAGFQLAGADGVFFPAQAEITAPDTVCVQSAAVAQPAAVRYAWYSFGPAELYGGTGLAAAPLNRPLRQHIL